MEYEVRAEHDPLWLQATGFYGEHGKAKAQRLIDEGYFNRYLYEKDKDTKFIVVPVKKKL